MGGRTTPTECHHGVAEYEFCEPCDEELIAEIVRVNTDIGRERRLAMHYAKHFPAEAVAQLVADGVLVGLMCGQCQGTWRDAICPACKGSGRDGTYRLVLPGDAP